MADVGNPFPFQVDPSIPLSAVGAGKPPAPVESMLNPTGGGGGGGLAGGLLDTMGKMNQLRLFQQTFAAKQRMGEILASSPDAEAGWAEIMKDPQVAPFAGEAFQAWRAGQLSYTQQQGAEQTQATDSFHNFLMNIPRLMQNPGEWDSVVNSSLALTSPASRPRVAAAMDAFRKGLTDGLPSDPVLARRELNKRLSAAMVTLPGGNEAIQGVLGKPETKESGGSLIPGVTAPVQGGISGEAPGQFTPSGPAVGKTLAPTVTTVKDPSGREVTKIVGGDAGATGTTIGAGPTAMGQKYLTERGGEMENYQANLDQRVGVGGTIMKTLEQARDALTSFKPGGGASIYAKVASVAQGLGADPALVDRIGNGDLGASQEFQKLMVNTTMGQIREQLQGVGASRLSQMEFQAFTENNPNIDTDPRAIEKIFNFWTKLYQQDHAEQTELNRYLKDGGDISEWPARWQDIAQQRGYINPQITNKTGKPAKRWDPTTGTLVPNK